MTSRRVLFVLENLETGGAERQAVALARALPKHGWRVTFALAQRRGPLLDAARAAGCRVHDLGVSPRPGSRVQALWEARRAMLRLMHVCRRERIRVLQSWFPWENVFSVPAGVLAPSVGAVVTCRRVTGGFRERSPLTLFSDRALNRLTDAIVCNAEAVRRDTIRREGVSPKRVLTIPNGIDPNDPQARAEPSAAVRAELLPEAGDGVLVTMLATLKPEKDQALFLRALALALEEEPRLRAALVGPDRGMQKRLRALVERLGIGRQVRFVGERSDPYAVVRASDFCALSSREEGMPNAVLEAMLCGRAVLSTRTPGTEELAVENETALLVPCGDAQAFAAGLVRLARDKPLRGRLGAAGRTRAVERFGIDEVARRYALLFDQLLSGVT